MWRPLNKSYNSRKNAETSSKCFCGMSVLSHFKMEKENKRRKERKNGGTEEAERRAGNEGSGREGKDGEVGRMGRMWRERGDTNIPQ